MPTRQSLVDRQHITPVLPTADKGFALVPVAQCGAHATTLETDEWLGKRVNTFVDLPRTRDVVANQTRNSTSI